MSDETLKQDQKNGGIQVIARAAAIMRALGNNPKGLSHAAIAQAVDLPRSTVQRIITALEEERLVESIGPQGGFRLGTALGLLINQTQTDIISSVQPFLIELGQLLNESVTLSSLIGDKVYVIDRVVAERELRIVFPIGINPPSFATSSGKILLAELSPLDLEAILPKQLPALTSTTLNKKALLAQLEQIRASGIAEETEEYIEGICSYATIIRTYLGNFSITVVAPASRAKVHAERFQAALLETKHAVERVIGRQQD